MNKIVKKMIAMGMATTMAVGVFVALPENTIKAADDISAYTKESIDSTDSFSDVLNFSRVSNASGVLYSSIESESVNAGGSITYNLEAKKAGKVDFQISSKDYGPVIIIIKDKNGKELTRITTQQYCRNEEGLRLQKASAIVTAGKFKVTYKSLYRLDYTTKITLESASSKKVSMNVTKGFSKKISVLSGKIKSAKSSNKKIATVDKKGKITGEKNGACKVTFNLTDGSKFTVSVKVVANSFDTLKGTPNKALATDITSRLSDVKYDKKGNLTAKFTLTNVKWNRTVSRCEGIRYNLYTSTGKKLGVFNINHSGYNIPAGSSTTITVKIPKSKLGIKKKIDLSQLYFIYEGGKCYH